MANYMMCPNCQTQLDVERFAGQVVACPQCATQLAIPAAPMAAVPEVPVRPLPQAYPRQSNLKVVVILLSLAVILLAALLTLYWRDKSAEKSDKEKVLDRQRESLRRTASASNLNQMAKACYMYADVPANGTENRRRWRYDCMESRLLFPGPFLP